MITLRRAWERHHDRRRTHDFRSTFHPQQRTDSEVDGFRALVNLDEVHVAPREVVPRRRPHDAEIVTYVREGAIVYENSMGGAGVLLAGEFQRVSAAGSAWHHEKNASQTHGAHLIHVYLRPSVALEPGYEHRRFSAAERRGRLRVIASPDARSGSLRIQQDVLLYAALLDSGMHIAYELAVGRSAWLHLTQGEVTFEDGVMRTGDGAGITGERAVSLTAREETEILLLDLG